MHFVRIGSFIFTLLILANSSANESVLKQLEVINRQTKLNPVSCAPESYSNVDLTASAKYCPAIEATLKSSDQHVCTPYYKNGVPHWENPAIKREVETYATAEAIAPSRSEFENRGLKIATQEEAEYLLERLDRIRKNMIPSCCDGNKECEKAMLGVNLKLCSDRSADKDSSAPDFCTLTNGYFLPARSKEDRLRIKKIIYSALKKQEHKDYVLNTTGDSEEEIDRLMRKLKVTPATAPVSGEVVVSPYFSNGASKVRDGTLRHEIAHACSSIKRQLAALDGDDASALSLGLQQRRGDLSCELHPSAPEAYSNLIEDVKEKNKVSKCLFKIAKESTSPTSYGFVKNSCPGSKLEEGFAIAREVLDAPRPLVPFSFPNSVCTYRPSTKHPAAAAVLDCLVQHSGAFRKELKKELECRF